MNSTAVGVLVVEVAAGALVEATGFGGPVAAGGAGAVIVATVAVLLARRRRLSLSVRIDRFLAQRGATEPLGSDAESCADYDTDTLDCYRSVFAYEVRLVTQRLRQDGVIGRNEAASCNRPSTVGEIERIVERLSEYESRR